MYRNKNISGRALTIPAGIGIGVACCLVITVLGSIITAWLVLSEAIGESAVGYLAMITLATATLCGVLVAAFLTKRLRLQVCMLTGVFYYLALLGATALFFGGQYQGMGVSAIIVLCSSGVVAFLPTQKTKIGKYKKKAYC